MMRAVRAGREIKVADTHTDDKTATNHLILEIKTTTIMVLGLHSKQ